MYKNCDKVFVKATVEKVTDDYVRIYAEGYGELSFCLDNAPVENKTYEQGLADAWDLAKKIVLSKEKGGLSAAEIFEIFGLSAFAILERFTYEEALAKIEAYEKEKEVKVGSIVTGISGGKGVVTRACGSNSFYVMWEDGRSGNYRKDLFEKTGRTAEGLTELLRQIGE